ncbi:hypothetical protein MiAbW_01493 [Microcystis aeruginosa NIES-4325]|uniref:DnaD domain-containing protein n=1 Tax=Microcystis aeruginosa NIES-4325 TaxID=2569534 RepID=A0A5J4F7K0_MICAE|nr:hypothetical protein [Microcystis aeruginosa]GEA26933.1 hypothetical protein MiAbW_01493 [Microcystis aeruginosa NIES-4325]
MAEINPEINLMQIATILNQYRFEMRGYKAQELIERWLPTYSLNWIRMAILEALYQGRYKVISVEEILKIWHRRGHPTFHFTGEFERLVCKNLPDSQLNGKKTVVIPKEEQVNMLSATLERPDPEPQALKTDNNGTVAMAKDSLFNLETSLFDDPRQGMSDVEELFSQLTTETPKFPELESVPKSANGHGTRENFPANFKPVIDEFTPLLDPSELYPKLKAVARSQYK